MTRLAGSARRLLILLAILAAGTRAATGAELERVDIPAPHLPGGTLVAYMMRASQTSNHARTAAVVALHGCGGIYRNDGRQQERDLDWARRLAAQGYTVLFPDSFGSRGLGPQCTVKNRTIRVADRAPDVHAAARWLGQRPFVERGKIAVIGWSHGGSATLSALDARLAPTPSPFKVGIAFYPGCRIFARDPDWKTSTPLHILMGAADDWTPPAPCRDLATRQNISYTEYPAAYHGFDAPNSPVRVRTGLTFSADGSGRAHLGTNPAARAAAIAEVQRILAKAFE